MPTTSRSHAAPLLTVGCIILGLDSPIVKFVHVGSYAIIFWRLATVIVIFWLLARFFGQKLPQNRKAAYTALLSGVFLAFNLALWHESIHTVGSGISTLLSSLQILFLSAIGLFFYRERLNKLRVLSLLLVVVGAALIGNPEFGHSDNAVQGFVSDVISGAVLALSMVFIHKTHQIEPVPLFPVTMILNFDGAVSLITPALVFDDGTLYPTTLRDIGWVLVCDTVMQCFAWGLIAYSILVLSLSPTGLLLLFEPVAALLVDYFLLHRPINGLQWGGAALTLAAIYLGSREPKP